jgi:RHS repeat-associated protein
MVDITDAASHQTAFAYDALGRVTQVTFPSTLSESYTYDAVNNLLTKTDRKNQTIQYGYDPLYRQTSKTYPDSTAVYYTYDPLGRLTQVTDPTGAYSFTYDNLGRLLGTSTQYSFLGTALNNSYSYDAASNRVSFTNSESGTTNYAYDTLNRLTSLTDSNTGQFGFGYDALGRRTSLARPNGVGTSYSYDTVSRLLSVLHNGGSLPGSTGYTYDPAGNRLTKMAVQEANPNPVSVLSQYSYDPIYELTQAVVNSSLGESYSYDAVGNRLTSAGPTSYNYNASNELTSTSAATYTYDNNGNTVSKTTSAGTTNYTWDFENRLTSVTLPGQGGTVDFRYDPFGNRIKKFSSVGTTIYVYDGDNVIQELGSAGNLLVSYTQSSGVDEPLAQYQGLTTAYFQADGLGSITSLTDPTGAVAASYVYDSFGNLTASTGTTANPFLYSGREYDPETTLYYYRARYYHPVAGRFLSEDPSGLGNSSNLYLYVNNRPIVFSDPFGLYKLIGFPSDKENQMRQAIQDAEITLHNNPCCTGSLDARKIRAALAAATFVYKADLKWCGYINPLDHVRHHIQIGLKAFDPAGGCCKLESTLAHEASHLGANTSDKDIPNSAYDLEKKCFDCGTGHPPKKGSAN